jgi:protein O-GlcNAc transferase
VPSDAANILFLVKRRICDWKGIEKVERKLDRVACDSPLTSILRHENPEKNYKAAKVWSQNLQKEIGKTPYSFNKKERAKKKKIRIGYLSADLQNHPVGQMMSGMLKYHDRKKFEIFVYSCGKNDGTVFQEMIREGADQFFDVSDINDSQVSDIIFAHGVDILVDLMGYTINNRLKICARRPAPIQVSWLGFPGTTGADFFDYLVADKVVISPDDAKFYSEKLMYLPRCYQVNSQINSSNKKFKRADFGLPEKGIIFASFNQPYKIEPVIWKIWMNILKRVPTGILWLWEENSNVVMNLQREAKEAGIDSKRLIFSKRLSKEEHLARIKLVDLGLDTRIYGGHTTTSDFLWAGVPVITKIGKHFASRVCASILKEAGLSELICNSFKEYEKKAVELALNPEKLNNLKQKITQEKLKKSLFDTQGFAKDLEKTYVKMQEDMSAKD